MEFDVGGLRHLDKISIWQHADDNASLKPDSIRPV